MTDLVWFDDTDAPRPQLIADTATAPAPIAARHPLDPSLYVDIIERVCAIVLKDISDPLDKQIVCELKAEWEARLLDNLKSVETWKPKADQATVIRLEEAEKTRLTAATSAPKPAVTAEPVVAVSQNPHSKGAGADAPTLSANQLMLFDGDADEGAVATSFALMPSTTLPPPVATSPALRWKPSHSPPHIGDWKALDSPQHPAAPLSPLALSLAVLATSPSKKTKIGTKKTTATLRSAHVQKVKEQKTTVVTDLIKAAPLHPTEDLVVQMDALAVTPFNRHDTTPDLSFVCNAQAYLYPTTIDNAKKTHDASQGQLILRLTGCVLILPPFELLLPVVHVLAVDDCDD